MNALVLALLCIVGTLVLVAVVVAGFFAFKKTAESVRQFNASMLQLAAVSKDMASLPAYVAGYQRIAEAMVKEIATLRESIETFTRTITPIPDPNMPLYQPHDDSRADTSFAVSELLRQQPHMSMEEARAMVKTYPATAESLGL
jgi:hypothetical protein